MKVKNIVELLIKKYPLAIQAEWDQSGIIVTGNLDQKIGVVIVALDLTDEVIDFCIRNNSNLIITHHPVFTNSEKHQTTSKEHELLERLKMNQITYLALHTNFDFNQNGMNYHILKKLDLVKIGNYQSNELNIFEAKTRSPKVLSELIDNIRLNFNVNKIIVQEKDLLKQINTVALVAGSGFSSFVPVIETLSKDVDLVITGDVKWHDWNLANLYNLTTVDVGHDLEDCFIDIIEEVINQKYKLLKVMKKPSSIKFKFF